MTNKIKNEERAEYNPEGLTAGARRIDGRMQNEADKIISQALALLEARLRDPGQALISPDDVKNYLRLKLAEREREVFAALWMDNRHRVIAYEELFQGTVDGASVYPREVVKSALACNAVAVIFVHNHPSGVAEPSGADRKITGDLKDALALVGVRVLDHMIVGGMDVMSFSEKGLI